MASVVLLWLMLTPMFGQQLNVLVLHSYHVDLPWEQGFDAGLKTAAEAHGEIQYFMEYLDVSRTGSSMTDQEWGEHLQAKYRNVSFQGIFAEGGPAVNLLFAYPELFGAIPQVLFSPLDRIGEEYQYSVSPQIAESIADTVHIALSQNPQARNALIIDGANTATNENIERIQAALNSAGIEWELYSHFSLQDLERRVASLQPHTLVFYTLVFRDNTGQRFTPSDVLSRLAEVSPAPIYTFWQTLLGTGTVGGSMLDSTTVAKNGVGELLWYMEHREFRERFGTNSTHFDWRALKRFDIDTISQTEDAEIHYRPVSFFARFYVEIITITELCLLVALAFVLVLLRKKQQVTVLLQKQGDELNEALSAQMVLYREMNNRIKNNLSILSSLVSLQMGETADLGQQTQLMNIVGRLDTLALLHEELSSEHVVSQTNAAEYCRSLVLQVFAALKADSSDIALNLDIDTILLDNKTAVAVGLIFHELLTNAYKHAFADRMSGSITIGFNYVDANSETVELKVADNGRGLPNEFDVEHASGMGLRIVSALAKQLGGVLRIASGAGTEFTIRFSIGN